jgi:hypothetical protein
VGGKEVVPRRIVAPSRYSYPVSPRLTRRTRRCIYTYNYMKHVTKKLYAVRLDAELLRLLKIVKARDGVPESEQIRRALARWFEEKGVLKSKRKS